MPTLRMSSRMFFSPSMATGIPSMVRNSCFTMA